MHLFENKKLLICTFIFLGCFTVSISQAVPILQSVQTVQNISTDEGFTVGRSYISDIDPANGKEIMDYFDLKTMFYSSLLEFTGFSQRNSNDILDIFKTEIIEEPFSVPEPMSMLLFGAGIAVLACLAGIPPRRAKK